MAKSRKGIILAGGEGSRLRPLTQAISKQLLPIYDKPMIYYPLTTLMLAGIKEVLIITTPKDNQSFKTLLGDGSNWGMKIEYTIQDKPKGLADSFILGDDFLDGCPGILILGDNIYYGNGWASMLANASKTQGFSIFTARVPNPDQFGIIELDDNLRPLSVEEKPENPKSNLAITGLYFFENEAVSAAKNVQPSKRGELEITSVIEHFMLAKDLTSFQLPRGFAWLDAGTHHGLQQAGNLVQTLQDRQGLLIASPEEIAYRQGFIDLDQFSNAIDAVKHSEYGYALQALRDDPEFINR